MSAMTEPGLPVLHASLQSGLPQGRRSLAHSLPTKQWAVAPWVVSCQQLAMRKSPNAGPLCRSAGHQGRASKGLVGPQRPWAQGWLWDFAISPCSQQQGPQQSRLQMGSLDSSLQPRLHVLGAWQSAVCTQSKTGFSSLDSSLQSGLHLWAMWQSSPKQDFHPMAGTAISALTAKGLGPRGPCNANVPQSSVGYLI